MTYNYLNADVSDEINVKCCAKCRNTTFVCEFGPNSYCPDYIKEEGEK
jgi:hypothetical protein